MEADIAGTTSGTYTLVTADWGNTIKVKLIRVAGGEVMLKADFLHVTVSGTTALCAALAVICRRTDDRRTK